MRKVVIVIIFIIVIAWTGVWFFREDTTPNIANDVKYSLVFSDDLTREYVVHLPLNYRNITKSLPLVLAFHGGGGTPKTMKERSGFNKKADKEEFIVVYPIGKFKDWNVGSSVSKSHAKEKNIADVEFVRLLIERIVKDFLIDDNRIYATGFSNGSVFTYRLACELPDIISAIAPVSGASFGIDCSLENSVNILMFNEGHIWPEGATEAIWEFFKNNPKS